MKSIVSLFRALHADDTGAAFIEYTALLGVILAIGIGVLTVIGGWADGVWDALCGDLKNPDGTSLVCPS